MVALWKTTRKRKADANHLKSLKPWRERTPGRGRETWRPGRPNGPFAALLLLIGGYLAVCGVELIALGGSWYYTLAGAALVAAAVLISIRNSWGPRVYAGALAVTLVWSIAEAGLDLIVMLFLASPAARALIPVIGRVI